MQTFTRTLTGIDGTEAALHCYVIDNYPETGEDRRRPAVLVLPGGGYEMTADREAEPIALTMVGYGYQAFALRYSVAPSRYPVALLEEAEAMRQIRANAADWHVDPDRIVVIGFSAGGHLAASIGTAGSDDTLRAHGYDPAEVRPDGMALCYPVVTSGEHAHRGSFAALLGDRADDPAMLEKVSLERQVADDTPPTFIWHTMDDDCVPVENSLLLIRALHAHHVPVEAHLFPTGPHGLSLASEETRRVDGSGVEPGVWQWPALFRDWMGRALGR